MNQNIVVLYWFTWKQTYTHDKIQVKHELIFFYIGHYCSLSSTINILWINSRYYWYCVWLEVNVFFLTYWPKFIIKNYYKRQNGCSLEVISISVYGFILLAFLVFFIATCIGEGFFLDTSSEKSKTALLSISRMNRCTVLPCGTAQNIALN